MSFLGHSREAWPPAIAALAVALISAACTAPPSPPAASPPAPSASPPAAPPPSGAPDASSAARPADAPAAAHVVHYDLVLARTEGATTTRASFSLDLSDAAPGAVTIAKNVSVSPGGRADVGAHVKARLTMQGTTPRLDVDVDISSADATGKLRHATFQGAAPTPAGAAAVLLDATDNGAQVRLTATPSATITLEGAADPSSAAYDLDVVVAHTGPGAPSKPTALTLKLAGDAPAIARVGESVPLSAGDAGATARQDVGTRVKVAGHGRGTSLELDFDLETSALEPSSPVSRIRKIISRGHLVAPFDKETVVFSGEEDGHRYVVKLTPRRAKAP